ncbi:hypothetical protein [Moritella marina]|uniref:hypothetical protein n=1 Tax=Moritella marina TaxID=90736 RepID=UPI0003106EDB|nr:hypothetical protein [Moritella marina]
MDIQSGLGSLCRLISMKSTKRFHAQLEERGVIITPEQHISLRVLQSQMNFIKVN